MQKAMSKSKTKNITILLGFLALLCFVSVVSFRIGKFPIPITKLFQILFSKILPITPTWSSAEELVVFKIRLPRVFAGALIGAGLSVAGSAYQAIFRNPMVSPDILGASSGAGFGAAVALYFGFGQAVVSTSAFGMGGLAVIVAYVVGANARKYSTMTMVLSGIMISSLFTSGTSLVKLVADKNNTLPTITYWLMGSISSVTTLNVLIAGIPISLGIVALIILSWKLNIFTMGDEEARSMGVNVKSTRLVVILAATLITASCVAISGMIGWIGLVIPHFARIIIGQDYRYNIPCSALMGASFLIIVDTFARSIHTTEIPIGILTAFIGAPFFLYLILRKRH